MSIRGLKNISEEMDFDITRDRFLLKENKENQLKQNSRQLHLKELHSLPHCIYLLDQNSATISMNEAAAESCGHDSPKNAIGKTIADIADKITADKVVKMHQQTMENRKLVIIEEDIFLKDEACFQALTILRPWVTEEDKLIGIFGCSVILNTQPLSQVLLQLIDSGILNDRYTESSCTKYSNFKAKYNIDLSQRERQCLQLYVLGKTAKEIAKRINLSYRTIEHYINNIKYKLHVKTRSELIEKVIEYFS